MRPCYFAPAVLAALFAAAPPARADEALDAAFQKLQEAETKKDAPAVKTLAAETCALARKAAAEPAPEAAEEKKAWQSRVAQARDIEVRTEYALYATAIQSPPAVTVDLISALEQQNPKSKYLDDAYARYFVALSQTGATGKVPAIAEKALANFPENEDLLMVMADASLSRKQNDRALVYARRLVASLGKHSRPEGYPAADWERKRSIALGRGYWIAGMVTAEKSQFAEANRNLRAALPYIGGNNAMMGPALYYLGVANYQLGKIALSKAQVLEAARFSEQAASIEGPYAQHALHNALVMKQDAAKMR